jgi:hypothetical protein
MLLPDEENLPAWLRAELDALREDLGPDPPIDLLRAARCLLSPRGRAYLRELAVRVEVTRVALEMLASGELADVDFGDDATAAPPTDTPAPDSETSLSL